MRINDHDLEFLRGKFDSADRAYLESSLWQVSKQVPPLMVKQALDELRERRNEPQEPATLDDIPWEPVTLEKLQCADPGIYEFRKTTGAKVTVVRMDGECPWKLMMEQSMKNDELMQWYTDFRKLPIALYTPAPEPAKRYEVCENPSTSNFRWRVFDRTEAAEVGGSMPRGYALSLCEKLNRLEELEAAQ